MGAGVGAGAEETQQLRQSLQQELEPSVVTDGAAAAIPATDRLIPAAERHSIPGGGSATAVAAAAGPPDGTREMAAARGGVFPTPLVDWTTARHDQPPETATTQRRQYQGTPAATRLGSRCTGMSRPFALLEDDGHMICCLATGPEVDGDLELPANLPCDFDGRNGRAPFGGVGAQGICRTYSGWDV